MHLFYVFRLIACVVSVHTFLNQSALGRRCGQNQCSPFSLPMKFPWYPNEPVSSWKPMSIFQFVLGVKSKNDHGHSMHWPVLPSSSQPDSCVRLHINTRKLALYSVWILKLPHQKLWFFFFKVAVCWLPPELTPRKKKCRTVSVWVKKQAI